MGEALLALIVILAIVTVVGHCIWLVLAFLFRQLNGIQPPPPLLP